MPQAAPVPAVHLRLQVVDLLIYSARACELDFEVTPLNTTATLTSPSMQGRTESDDLPAATVLKVGAK